MATEAKDKKDRWWLLAILLLLLIWYWWHKKKPAAAAPASPTPAPNPESNPNNPPIVTNVGTDIGGGGTDVSDAGSSTPDLTGTTQIGAVTTQGGLSPEGFYTGTGSWWPGQPLADETIAGLNTWEYIQDDGINSGLGLYQAYLNAVANNADLTSVTDQINQMISTYIATGQWNTGAF